MLQILLLYGYVSAVIPSHYKHFLYEWSTKSSDCILCLTSPDDIFFGQPDVSNLQIYVAKKNPSMQSQGQKHILVKLQSLEGVLTILEHNVFSVYVI